MMTNNRSISLNEERRQESPSKLTRHGLVVAMILVMMEVIGGAPIGLSQPNNNLTLNPESCLAGGLALADGVIANPQQIAQDSFCARLLLSQHAPQGAVVVFGSARSLPNSVSYEMVRSFAMTWTKAHGSAFPILTGGGPGLMEAANRGANEAKGPSLGIGTYFAKTGQEKPNRYLTHYYMATSFAQREADLIDFAAAVVVTPGGYGTEWELYETLCKIQTGHKTKVPVILLGPSVHWQSFLARVKYLKSQGTIGPHDDKLFTVAPTTKDALAILEREIRPVKYQNP